MTADVKVVRRPAEFLEFISNHGEHGEKPAFWAISLECSADVFSVSHGFSFFRRVRRARRG